MPIPRQILAGLLPQLWVAAAYTNLSSGCTFFKEYDSHIEGVLEVAI